MSRINFINRVILVLGSLLVMAAPTVSAISQGDLNSILNHTPFFDPNGSFCSSTNYGSQKIDTTSGTPWISGLSAPFILEQFIIETLKDVAKKANVPESDVVTQEHVIALLAFIWGEGGDINNNDLFNPMNSNYDDPSLLLGPHSGTGVQSFKSFDAGVEATAMSLLSPYQTRVAAVLLAPKSTAEEFMYAITYYGNYDGNKEWAGASAANPDLYYKQHIEYVQQVRGDYQNRAGLIIGTPAHEEITNSMDISKLIYHPTSVVTDGSSCKYNNNVSTAIALAWPDYKVAEIRGHEMANATIAYQEAMPKYDSSKGNNEWSDCGVFVATVMRASGSDPNYPIRGTSVQYQYIVDHPEIYEIFTDIKDTSKLKPGDIFINSQHTYIYVGPQSSGYNSVSASLGDYVPQARGATFTNTLDGVTEDFKIVRMK